MMHRVARRSWASSFVLLVVLASPAFAQGAVSAPTLAPADMERFLLTGKLVSVRRAGNGVTNSQRATFEDGTYRHDVHLQSIDERRAIFEVDGATQLNFRDTYKYNVAAYRLSRMLGMSNVPMSVERTIQGKPSAVTWWIDDVQMDEEARLKTKSTGPDPARFAMQVHVMRVFDALIQNTDRNLGNVVWTRDWTMWLIDHTRAFRTSHELVKPERLERIDRTMLERLRGLTRPRLQAELGAYVGGLELDALLIRAGKIVQRFDQLTARNGEGAVVYAFLPSPVAAP